MNLESLSASFTNQFITIMILHLFAVMSPGPDFAVVTKQSFAFGRKYALITSLGIGVGILFHVIYCIVGVGLLLSTNKYLFNFFKIIGSLYLFYNGFNAIFYSSSNNIDNNNNSKYETFKKSFLLGFITNVFNPKATLFFLSLFTLIIDANTSLSVQIFYGFWMSFITILWFCIVSYFFTTYLSKIFIKKYSKLINRIMGIILVIVSLNILIY
tara:strand:- start:145 stop:783 length:639 start_codon:yes stop_codon:yes gene_type:complete